MTDDPTARACPEAGGAAPGAGERAGEPSVGEPSELLEEPEDEDGDDEEAEGSAELHRRAPWHFKVILVGTVIYLGYRSYQGIVWLVHHG